MHELFTSDIESRGVTDLAGSPLPLTGVSVAATLAGPFMTATMIQRWSNQGTNAVEALWRFPVPQGATVRSLVIERGGRRLVAEVRARDEAFDRYDRGMEDGKLSALLDAETEGVLAMRLGNLGPGESALVELSWVSVIEEAAGLMRLRLPTAIAPRYFPASYRDTAQVDKRDRLELPWAARVPYGITVDVDILESGGMAGVSSPSHTLEINLAASPVRVRLGGNFALMDRDFVLDLAPLADRPDRAWLEQDGRGAWIAADLRVPQAVGRAVRHVAILLDISGSMEGTSLEAARRAIRAGIASLGQEDSFGLYAFNNTVWTMEGSPHEVSAESLASARTWVDRLEASGGTELLPALGYVYSSGTWTDVLVITDGDVGNDDEVASLAGKRLSAGTRTSLLGIGDAPAMDALAVVSRAGGGSCATVHPGERIEARALSLFSGMLAARVEDPELKSGRPGAPGTLAAEPAAPIHAAAGARLRALARLETVHGVPESLWFTGTVAGHPIELKLPVSTVEARAGGSGGLQALWARDRVADILDRSLSARKPADARRLEKQAVALSIEAGILSTVASMVAVDEDGTKVTGDASFVEIPVLMPAGYGGGIMEKVSMKLARGASTSSPGILSSTVQEVVTLYSMSPLTSSMMMYESLDTMKKAAPRKKSKDLADETMLYELLALQLPGGGFGPEDEVLALLGAASLEEYARAIGLKLPAGSEDPAVRRILLARAVLATLSGRFTAQAAVWEPLIGASRKLASV